MFFKYILLDAIVVDLDELMDINICNINEEVLSLLRGKLVG